MLKRTDDLQLQQKYYYLHSPVSSFIAHLLRVSAAPEIGPGAEDTAMSKIDTSCFHGHTVVGSPDFSGLLTAFICISGFVL